MDHLLKIKNEFKNLKKQEIQAAFTKMNLIRLVLNMIRRMGDFKDLKRRTASDKILRDKAFNFAKNPKYDGYQRGLTSMVCKLLDKKSTVSGVNIPLEYIEQLAEELRKLIIRKFKKRKVYSGFKDNIWGVDLADMQLISEFNKRFFFFFNKLLLCVFDIFSKYAWVVPLKDRKSIGIVNAFQKILNQSARTTNKIWVDKGSKFYNNSFKKWLKDNDIEMYSIHNKGKSVVAESFIRTLKRIKFANICQQYQKMCISIN